jgi:TusA-related sulfurtransferase
MRATWSIACASICLLACAQRGTTQYPAPRTDMSGAKERGMAHCPSTVPGATTKAEALPDGVQLTVTGSDPATVVEIRDRAHHQAFAALHPGHKPHTGKGGGPGDIGYCPVVVVDSEVTATDLVDGAKITVKPKDPGNVGEIQKMTKERIEGLKQIAP